MFARLAEKAEAADKIAQGEWGSLQKVNDESTAADGLRTPSPESSPSQEPAIEATPAPTTPSPTNVVVGSPLSSARSEPKPPETARPPSPVIARTPSPCSEDDESRLSRIPKTPPKAAWRKLELTTKAPQQPLVPKPPSHPPPLRPLQSLLPPPPPPPKQSESSCKRLKTSTATPQLAVVPPWRQPKTPEAPTRIPMPPPPPPPPPKALPLAEAAKTEAPQKKRDYKARPRGGKNREKYADMYGRAVEPRKK